MQQPEHPQRYTVAVANFQIVNGKITVGNVFNLVERFPPASHLEQVGAICQEITSRRIRERMARSSQLGDRHVQVLHDVVQHGALFITCALFRQMPQKANKLVVGR